MRHGSWPKYPLSSIAADVRRSVRFIRQHAKEYGVDPGRIGVFGNSAGGHLALLLGTTGDAGDPSAADPVLRESSRVAAVVAYFPPTDLTRWGTERIRQAFAAMRLTDAEAAEYSPIRFVSPGAAPSLIVHGDADTTVPMVDGETMGTISSERALSWPLAIGAHEIEARDADGRRARTSVIVK